jgi:hypothetical protein
MKALIFSFKMMNQQLFELLLNTLHLKTLAGMAVDLETVQEAWRDDTDAPPEPAKQQLLDILKIVTERGIERAGVEQLDFEQLLEETREERQPDDWLAERNRQTQENWYSDYE